MNPKNLEKDKELALAILMKIIKTEFDAKPIATILQNISDVKANNSK